jgi:hypothetical protein
VYGAAARQGSSGEVARATGCTESTTNSMGVLLTSRRNSLAAFGRRNDGGGRESKAAAARVSGRRWRTGLVRQRWSPGWGRLELGDDMGAPAVGDSSTAQARKRLRRAGGGRWAGWAATLAGLRRWWSG